MIHLATKLPKTEMVVACSGGPDSLFLAQYLLNGNKKVKIAFFHHNTEASTLGEKAIEDSNLTITYKKKLTARKPKELSWETFWSKERNQFFREVIQHTKCNLLTAHTLSDAVEWYLMTTFKNASHINKIMRTNNNGILRPLLYTRKEEILRTLATDKYKHIKPYHDPENTSERYDRGFIRSQILPVLISRYPGIYSTVLKALKAKSTQHGDCA